MSSDNGINFANAFSYVYRLIPELNATQTLNQFFDRYAPGNPDTMNVREHHGQRLLGEYIIDETDPIWSCEIPDVSFAMRHALDDQDFHDVMHELGKGHKLEGPPTLGLITYLADIQFAGYMTQIGHKKKDELKKSFKNLSDRSIYKDVKEIVAEIYPELHPHLPEVPWEFILKCEDKNMSKDPASIVRKKEEYDNGLFGIKDWERARGAPLFVDKNGKSLPTNMERWHSAMAQVFAFYISGQFGSDLFSVNNHIAEANKTNGQKLEWAAANFHGRHSHKMQTGHGKAKLTLALGEERLIVPEEIVGERFGYFDSLTITLRKGKREEKKDGVDNGFAIAQKAVIKEAYQVALPELYREIIDPNQGDHPVNLLINQYTTHPRLLDSARKTKWKQNARNMSTINEVDLSGTNNFEEILAKEETAKALLRTLKEYPPKLLKTANINPSIR